jgi:transposase
MLSIGIDWADPKHDALALDEAGRKLDTLRVPHTAEGLAKLDAWLSSLPGGQDKGQMACIIETTHGLVIAFLLEQGWPVYPVNPRTVDRQRNAAGAKTDAIDAYLLAKTGRADFADLHQLAPDSEKVAELKGLTRDQDSLIQMQTRLVNQLTACLKDYYPVALDLFAKLQQRSTLLFLQAYPTPANSTSRLDRTNRPDPALCWTYHRRESGSQGLRAIASAQPASQPHHHPHQIAPGSGFDCATPALDGADRRLRQGD